MNGDPVPQASQTLTVDQTPPAAPGLALLSDSGSSVSDHITNNDALSVSGIENGAIVEYSIDGGKTWSSSFSTRRGHKLCISPPNRCGWKYFRCHLF